MATIKDVARLAGVGVGTASRAISGKGPISPDAIARVQAAIAELDFRPSQIGRALSARSLGMIGVFVPVISGTFYAPILQTADDELRAIGRHMVLVAGSGHGDMRQQAIEGVQSLIWRGCDGIIILSNGLLDEDLIDLHRQQPKIAVLSRHVEALAENCFSVDHHEGGRLAAKTLLQYGHRHLAMIGGPTSAPDSVERVEGFLEALAQAGIDPASVPVIDGQFTADGGMNAAAVLLKSHKKMTGLFCANDDMAMGAMSCLQEAGKRIPKDVSVIGYDDINIAPYTSPRLTSVHFPIQEVMFNSLRWLLNACYGSSHPIKRDFSINLTIRASLGPAPVVAA
ncbi:MAG: LacI family DNA-binding transcriptional regulator [Pseudomonadota bacterium]